MTQTTSTELDSALVRLAVEISVAPVGDGLPGEPLTLQVTLYNRGHAAAELSAGDGLLVSQDWSCSGATRQPDDLCGGAGPSVPHSDDQFGIAHS